MCEATWVFGSGGGEKTKLSEPEGKRMQQNTNYRSPHSVFAQSDKM